MAGVHEAEERGEGREQVRAVAGLLAQLDEHELAQPVEAVSERVLGCTDR